MDSLADINLQETFKGVFQLVAPEIALIGTACCLFLFACFYDHRGFWFLLSLASQSPLYHKPAKVNRRLLWFLVSIVGTTIAIILANTETTQFPPVIIAAPIIPDSFAGFIRWTALLSLLVLLFVSWAEVTEEMAAEYYGCLLIVAAGLSLVGRANDLVTLFLALELISIPTYILLYLPAKTKLNQEAAAKYFLLSVLSSAILLFGFSYLYGLAGSTNISVIVDAITKANAEVQSPMAFVAIVMVVAAMGFRITAVPFHFYAPDVYEGGPAGVVAQLAFIPKVAGFVVLARLLGLVGADPHQLPFDTKSHLPLLLWIMAILTMTLGNVLALLQDNIRRMLAYSSVAHAGYLLVGIIVACSYPDWQTSSKNNLLGLNSIGATSGGVNALLFYLAAYGMMTVGAFAVILALSTPERPIESIDDFAGLGQSHPVSARSMAVFMFSLIGMPLTAGFVGKGLLFLGALGASSGTPVMRIFYQILAVVMAVNAAVGAIYYLRVIGAMYLRTPLRPVIGSHSKPTMLAIVVLAAATLYLGCYPDPLWRAAQKAAPVTQPSGKAPA